MYLLCRYESRIMYLDVFFIVSQLLQKDYYFVLVVCFYCALVTVGRLLIVFCLYSILTTVERLLLVVSFYFVSVTVQILFFCIGVLFVLSGSHCRKIVILCFHYCRKIILLYWKLVFCVLVIVERLWAFAISIRSYQFSFVLFYKTLP